MHIYPNHYKTFPDNCKKNFSGNYKKNLSHQYKNIFFAAIKKFLTFFLSWFDIINGSINQSRIRSY